MNTLPTERVFHVEADDRQRVYVRFGYEGVVGVQPRNGTQLTLTVSYTAGVVSPAYASPFAFEYLASPADAMIELRMDALLVPGQNPPPMSVLRDLARYPSVYDASAVFLGEFDFLVRRNFPELLFLSVWGEAAEERARGASLDNINALFVACLSESGEQVLTEADPNSPVTPQEIAEGQLTDTQRAIRGVIRNADDSYRVRFVTPVRSLILMTITARVASSWVASNVREQIIDAILAEFGEEAEGSRRGRNRPLYQRVYALLRAKITALSGEAADLTVHIDDPTALTTRPEMWRYVSEDSLTVTVETVNAAAPSWGG